MNTHTGLFIGVQEVVVGTQLTSETIHFERDNDISRASGNFLTVEYAPEWAAFIVRHSETKRALMFGELLQGWKPEVFDILSEIRQDSVK